MDAVHPAPERLDDYVNHVLAEPAAARIEEHLADCDECARTCRQVAAISDAWAAWTGQQPRPIAPAAATPVHAGARRLYVGGETVVEVALTDMRFAAGSLHFTVQIDEEASLPDLPLLEIVFLETLQSVTIPLPADRKLLGRVGYPCTVDVPPALRRRFRAGLDAIALRIRSAKPPRRS